MTDCGGLTPALNHVSQNDSSPCNQEDTSTHVVSAVVHSLVFVVGLLLNGFTLRVYCCRAQQLTSSSVTIYLKNLAVADFLIVLCLPLRIAHYTNSSAQLQKIYCNFGAAAFYLNMYASILFMGYVSANRYLKIVYPLRTQILQTVRAAHIISMVTWVILISMTSIYITLSLSSQGTPPAVNRRVTCYLLHSEQLSVIYKITHIVSATIFLLVLILLLFFYASISHRLSVAQQRQPSSSKKLAKSRRNMMVLVGVFCFCFVPYHLVRLPYAFLRGRCLWRQTFFILKEMTIMVSVLNVCLDPLIYFIFCKAFRAQLISRRVVFSTTQFATQGQTREKQSSNERQVSGVIVSKMTKQISVL